MCEAYVAISGPRNLSILSCQGTFHYWSVFLFMLWRGSFSVCLLVCDKGTWMATSIFFCIFKCCAEKENYVTWKRRQIRTRWEKRFHTATIIDFFLHYVLELALNTQRWTPAKWVHFQNRLPGIISLHSAVSGFPPIGTVCCSLSVMLSPCATLCQLSVSVAQGHFFPGTEAPAWRMRDEFLFRLSGETL